MDPKLNRDFWPLWIVETVGLLFPAFLLLASLVVVAGHGQRTANSWLLLAWSTALVSAFLFRYRAQKLDSMAWEFHFGMWLAGAPMLVVAAVESGGKFRSVGAAVLGFGFVYNAANYVKRFYLSTKGTANGSFRDANSVQ